MPFSERRCSRHPHPAGRAGTLRGGPRTSTGGDSVDDCNCEDVAEMEARRYDPNRDRRGSPSRVYPQLDDHELQGQEMQSRHEMGRDSGRARDRSDMKY